MRLNKVEVNLRRLLEAAPRQHNQAKLVHYVTTARELLEQRPYLKGYQGFYLNNQLQGSSLYRRQMLIRMKMKRRPEEGGGASLQFPFWLVVSKAKISEYSEKIEALAARLAAPVPENKKPVVEGREEEISDEKAKAVSPISLSSGLQRRSAAHAEVRPSYQDRKEISEHLSNWMQKPRLTLRSTGSCKKI
ncbi:hypothetical protein PAHAL_6G278900 [Panicum hallii]|uniref:Uncharacterized protein n=1 Tax=Panicum hallii TaxID=206008 RepID=A0A2S3I498_9POAL|nr:hypothetical protein PAHAL_6G278900 [Panicum hallii]